MPDWQIFLEGIGQIMKDLIRDMQVKGRCGKCRFMFTCAHIKHVRFDGVTKVAGESKDFLHFRGTYMCLLAEKVFKAVFIYCQLCGLTCLFIKFGFANLQDFRLQE